MLQCQCTKQLGSIGGRFNVVMGGVGGNGGEGFTVRERYSSVCQQMVMGVEGFTVRDTYSSVCH